MSQCSLPGTGSLFFFCTCTLIKENHSTSPAFFKAMAQEHALAVCLDRWHATVSGKHMPSRNTGWQTALSPVNQNRHSCVGSHQLATRQRDFSGLLFAATRDE